MMLASRPFTAHICATTAPQHQGQPIGLADGHLHTHPQGASRRALCCRPAACRCIRLPLVDGHQAPQEGKLLVRVRSQLRQEGLLPLREAVQDQLQTDGGWGGGVAWLQSRQQAVGGLACLSKRETPSGLAPERRRRRPWPGGAAPAPARRPQRRRASPGSAAPRGRTAHHAHT